MQLAAPAHVRPRCFDPDTGEVVLLEDEISEFLRTHELGTVEIFGGPGSGKTRALEYLAALMPPNVQLLDNADAEDIDAATGRILIYASRTRRDTRVDLRLPLAPWSDDELIEYLLAAHSAECGFVMQRLLAAEDRHTLGGLPMLCAMVLEQMAAHAKLASAKDALRGALDIHRTHPIVRELAGSYSWTLQINGPRSLAQWQARRLREAGASPILLDCLRSDLVQRMLAAEHLFRALAEHRAEEFLVKALPQPLLEETAHLARNQKSVIEELQRLADHRSRRYQATAASLLHACGRAWRPAVRRRARLMFAQLDGIAWSGVNLAQAHLYGARLNLAELSEARLDRAQAAHSHMRGARLQGSRLTEIDASHAELSHADLSGADAREANFYNARLVRCRCRGAILVNADLDRADLTGADLTGANLAKASLLEATIDDANFTNVDLNSADLSHLPLYKARWDGARFTNTLLRNVNLEDIQLHGANFERATLIGAHLTGSRMRRANFRGANLRNSGLADIDWQQADLRSADLRCCTFHMGSTRSGLLFTPFACEGSRTGFYTDDYEEQYFKRPEEIRKANLRGADLRGARIDDVDFYLVDLRDALYTPDQAEHFRRCRAILDDH